MANDTDNLFSVGVLIANIRAQDLNLQIGEQLCNCFADSFYGSSSTVGQIIYQQISSPSTVFKTNGIGSSTIYDTIEQNITSFIQGNYPESLSQDKNLALGVNSILFAWSLFPEIQSLTVLTIINQLIYNIASQINNNPVITRDQYGNVTNSIFTIDNIQLLLNSNNYSQVLSQIITSPKDTKVNLVNYNWYNVSGLFTQPNLQIMRDVENQYYYISGNLIYDSLTKELDECIQKNIVINTPTGIITGTYIFNQPCIDNSQLIAPITGVSFYRLFNDGPSSIGDFNPTIKTQYIAWDQQILNFSDYNSNEYPLFSFETGISGGYIPLISGALNVVIKPNGLYNLEGVEYGHTQDDFACVGIYQRMHIGDNRPRDFAIRDIHGNCISGDYVLEPLTGFKFASLKLNKSWAPNFAYIKTNPVSSTNDYLTRALNINKKAYLSSDGTGSFYTDLGIQDDEDITYLGPPQVSGGNVLPGLAFFQEFWSPTFGDINRLAFYATVGTSNEGGGSGIDSNRTFAISNNLLFSGEQAGDIPLVFSTVIQSSNLVDDITKQFFGMGDNFNNQYTISGGACQNAGYYYTGYYLIDEFGNITNIIQLSNDSGTVLGSPYESINYINGYSGDGNNFAVSQMISQDSSGNLYNYYYLDNRKLNGIKIIEENNWEYFAPLPSEFEDDDTYSRTINTQNVENYFPRYQNGPYSTEEIAFLYPNAATATSLYNSQVNGFPQKIQFTLSVKEETIREVYGYYFINKDGVVLNLANTPVIRASSSGTQKSEVYMNQFFIPDNVNNEYIYNITNLGDDHFEYSAGIGLVDNLYSPLVNGVLPSGRNQNLYSDVGGQGDGKFTIGRSIYSEDFPIVNGIRITGQNQAQSSTFYTGTGFQQGATAIYWQVPKSDGLWHYFNENIISGNLEYVKPIFDLSMGTTYITKQMKEAFYNLFHQFGGQNWDGCQDTNDACAPFVQSYFRDIHGYSGIIQSGFDPYSLQYIGGQSGGLLASEGGYNTEGVIGDLWNNFSYDYYGMVGQENLNPGCAPFWRWPYYDSNIVLINANTQTTNILTRGLNYFPFNITNIPFVSFQQIPVNYSYKLNGTTGTLNLNISGDYASFNLANYMPLINTNDGLYDPVGLVIGPFDRDIEMGVLGNNQLMANGDIYSQGHQISNFTNLISECDINAQIFQRNGMNTGIFPGTQERDPNFTIIDIVPSGQVAIINISGLAGIVGWSGAAILSLRPRKVIGQSVYDNRTFDGESDWISNIYFVNNGAEQSFSLTNGGSFESLSNKSFTFYSSINTGKLYPVPGNDITGMGTLDKFGNLIYPPGLTVENYWKQWAFKNKTGVYFSGVREGSRVCFTFTDIQVSYNQIPYQQQSLITPSGSCLISGQMGYYAEADNSIFTEGAFLVDTTDPVIGDFNPYEPYFLSDVLLPLIPTYLNPTSGQLNRPILSFPSVMEQREYISGISGGQSYVQLLNSDPENYNKFLWPAISDLFMLNPSETIEQIPPSDGLTYTNSNCIFSAAQGQILPNGLKNPNINIQFDISGQFQLYDSVATSAIINSGTCITQNRGPISRLNTGVFFTGGLFPENTTLSLILAGLV